MAKYLVIAPLRVSQNYYIAAIQDEYGVIRAGKLNLDTWCQIPASYRDFRRIYPTTVKSKLRPLTNAEIAVLNSEHPNFTYNFVWGADE